MRNDIHEFRIQIPQADVDDLNTRLAMTRWPAAASSGDKDWSRGVPPDYLKELATYWEKGFDWRAQEAALNAIPQFRTEFDGQTIHFFHVRSPEPDALPLILTHSWPSSPVEFLNLVGPLTNPREHGGDPADAFHVVIPSLPGYGFSTPLGPAGFNLFSTASMWAQLMSRLGYERFAAHGTDAGSGVAGMLPMVAPGRVVGIHMTGTNASTPFGPPLELDNFTGADRERAENFNKFREEGIGYLSIQSTRPQTLAYSLNDSPVGQLAWITEKFHEWTDVEVDRDELLTNVSLYWFTGSGASSAHALYDGMRAWKAFAAQADEATQANDGGGSWATAPAPPTAVAVFAADTTIRGLMDPAGTMRWTEYDRGGHFPGMEVPDLLIEDIRTFLRPIR